MQKIKKTFSRGFTLIELLIVIAVLGVLAASVLVVINPVEQLARGRDTGRKSSVSQVGRALQSYYTTRATYPLASAWGQELTVNTGELKTFPENPTGITACTVNPYPNATGFCYNTGLVAGVAEAVVFTHLESKAEVSKCANVAANTWYVWSSAEGRSGVLCQAAAPQPGATGLLP